MNEYHRYRVQFSDGLFVFLMSYRALDIGEQRVLAQAERLKHHYGYYRAGITFFELDEKERFSDQDIMKPQCVSLLTIRSPG